MKKTFLSAMAVAAILFGGFATALASEPSAAEQAREGFENIGQGVQQAAEGSYQTVKEGTVSTYEKAKEGTEGAYQTVREGTVSSYEKAKEGTVGAYEKVKEAIHNATE